MFLLFALFHSPASQKSGSDDERLLHAIAQGHSAALGELYDRYGRLVFSIALIVVNDEAGAEEITQEVFLQVWNKSSSYQPGLGRVATWLSSITRHRAVDSLRRRGARPEGHQAAWEEDEEGDGPVLIDPQNVEGQVEDNLQSRAVRRAIHSLPQDQQRALALAYFEGLSHQEIAETTGEPLGTVKTRIRLAMLKLRTALEGM